jgi:hypothetical protein
MSQDNKLVNLQKLLSESGFVDSLQLINSFSTVPEGVLVMHNQYALIACSCVNDSETKAAIALKSVQEKLHNFVREVLLEFENQKGLIVDGYLLLVLGEEPDKETREVIQELEQNTKVCRKHVLWSYGDEVNLERTQYVTVLSLPRPLGEAAEVESSFSISKEAKNILMEYEKQGNLDRLMDSIKSGVLKNAD